MIGLIALDSLIYSSRLALRKNYIFNNITPFGHMLYGTLCTLFFTLIWYFFDPDTVLNMKDINGIKNMGFTFLFIESDFIFSVFIAKFC